MHRLPRQILHSGSPSLVLRARRPSGLLRNDLLVLKRQYASSSEPGPPSHMDKFDKLSTKLRPFMPLKEFATLYAALMSSTEDRTRLEKLDRIVGRYLKTADYGEASFYASVNRILADPPEDNFDSLLAVTTESSSQLPESSSQTLPKSNGSSLNHPSEHPAQPTKQAPLPEHTTNVGEASVVELEHRSDASESNSSTNEIEKSVLGFGSKTKVSEPVSSTSEQSVAGLKSKPVLQTPDGSTSEPDNEPRASEPVLETFQSETPSNPKELKNDIESVHRPGTGPGHIPEAYTFADATYPDLMETDSLLDFRDVLELPPDKDTPFHNRVIVRNHSSIFNEAFALRGHDLSAEDYEPTKTDETEELTSSLDNLPLSPKELSGLYRFPLIHKRITQQTGKGKIHRQFVLMVVGDGNGMVGLGQGKDEEAPRAEAKAFAQAVRNMDWVARFENRTIWTEMETKLGATQLILRPRPVGFGLRCNPNLHQVLKAAGIKDISAKVWGSRNPINVIKAAFRMLQSGHAPLAMGDGIGGPGRKLNKGHGLRSKDEVERERGRQLISLRK